MHLSEKTVSVLKNFSTINQNLLIKEGQTLSTMSAMKNIVANATVEETFPKEVAIYDLNEFLSVLSLFSQPDLEFKDDFVIITDGHGSAKTKYWYSDPSVVTSPQKEVQMPSKELEFSFSSDTLSQVQKAAAVIGAPDMVLTSEDNSPQLRVTDKKNSTANDYSVDMDTIKQNGEVKDYKFWFKVENLKLMPGTYDVAISSKKISHFVNEKGSVDYFIALEPESKYDD